MAVRSKCQRAYIRPDTKITTSTFYLLSLYSNLYSMLALPSKNTFYVKISIWHGNSSHTEPYIEYINTHSRYITSALTTLIDNSTLNIHQPTFLDPVANEVRAQSLNSIFLFYFLALSLRSFTGSHGIVPIYIFTILLRNTISRSS